MDISYCRSLDQGLPEMLSSFAPNLKSLNISGLLNSIDDMNFHVLGYLKELEDLNASLCYNIFDDGLVKYAESKPKLLRLNIGSLYRISSRGLCEILSAISQTIIDLNISLMPQEDIDDKPIKIVSKMANLQFLNISGTNFEDISSLTVLEELRSINASGIQSVDNQFCFSLLSKNLSILRVSNCMQLSDELLEGISNFDKKRNKLCLLEINRTPLISDKKIKECEQMQRPNLRIIRSSNLVWNKHNLGLKIPLMPKDFEKQYIKGMKKPPAKKKDDKNPMKLYEKFMNENKPTRALNLDFA